MNKPYIDSIITKSDSKYLLIVAAAKRARQITLLEPELTRSGKINPVSAALHEINDDELTWEIGQPEAAEADEPAAATAVLLAEEAPAEMTAEKSAEAGETLEAAEEAAAAENVVD